MSYGDFHGDLKHHVRGNVSSCSAEVSTRGGTTQLEPKAGFDISSLGLGCAFCNLGLSIALTNQNSSRIDVFSFTRIKHIHTDKAVSRR